MKDGPTIAPIAALIGDPARANMLMALMDGRALTASELAQQAGVTLQTASGHLSKLEGAGLLVVEKQGRHRYFRLSGVEVAHAIETLEGVAALTGAVRVRPGPKDPALRKARVCYDHLAGERGVAALVRLRAKGLIAGDPDGMTITPRGRRFFTEFGIELDLLERGRRPLCLACLDWSERRHHLGGALGAALLTRLCALGWAKREPGRVVAFTPRGEKAFEAAFG
jgi:DNA-binding transcriptional ArsR family regulator